MSKLSSAVQSSGVIFSAIPSKSGKVTSAAIRQSEALNSLSRAALLGVALVGKGAMRRIAAETFKREAVTLVDYFDAAEKGIAIDGSRYGELRALIAADLGSGHLTPVKGKAGCMALCEVAHLVATRRYLMAETEKQQSAASATIDRIEAIRAMVSRHYELSEAAMLAAQAVKDAQATEQA